MQPYYVDTAVTLHHGDCLDVLRSLPDASVDSVVTDPPYGLGFMGKEWDDLPPGLPFAVECLRVLKPGGHLLAFGGTRTWHRLACAVEDAGFEVRDSIAWLYGSGFPKSLDVSKAIDKQRDDRADVLRVTTAIRDLRDEAGKSNRDLDDLFGFAGMAGHWTSTKSQPTVPTVEQWTTLRDVLSPPEWLDAEVWRLNGRKGSPGDAWQMAEVTGIKAGAMSGWNMDGTTRFVDREEKAPATPEAAQWQGWGTALKPAFEPVVVARKPLSGTVAANVLTHGTGALNVDGCRINPGDVVPGGGGFKGGATSRHEGWTRPSHLGGDAIEPHTSGRWPANVALDESQAAALDEQSGFSKSPMPSQTARYGAHEDTGGNVILGGGGLSSSTPNVAPYGDKGGASRFFYVAKAPKRERPNVDGVAHPTVKPLTLMRWLVRLVTPPGGTVLEPFAGSGTTVEACLLEGFRCVAIERSDEYLPLILERVRRQREAAMVQELARVTDPEAAILDQLDLPFEIGEATA